MPKLKLNIGCGLSAPAEWTNIDNSLNAWLAKWPWFRQILVALRIMPLSKANIHYSRDIYIYDVSKGLPFVDNSAEAIYCSHLLEHFKPQDAYFFIQECCRVLTEGGIIRIIVPDLEQYTRKYIERTEQLNQKIPVEALPSEKFLDNLGIFDKEAANESMLMRFYKKLSNKNTHKWMYDEYALAALLKKYGFSDIQRRVCYESLISGIEKIEIPERFNYAVCLEAKKL
jgi:predicted SAM-dependent methyltransferase